MNSIVACFTSRPGVRKLRIAGVNHGHLDWEMLLKEERHGCWGFLCTTKILCIWRCSEHRDGVEEKRSRDIRSVEHF